MMKYFFLFFSCLMGCGSPQLSRLNWGHSTDLDKSYRASDFLFGIEAGTPLHACIEGQSGSSDWLKAELFTAVNIWAQVVGRSLPLVFDGCKQAPALRLVFSKAPVSGDFVGYTLSLDGERIVYLDPAREWRSTGEILGFDRQPELKSAGWEDKARFLFPLIADGSYSSFKLPMRGSKSPQSSLSTLMHELGHAWGLCDLYDERSTAPAFNSNCSLRNRSRGLLDDEIMTAATNPGTARLYLSAADKEGIRALFARADFPQSRSWGKNTEPLSNGLLLEKTLGKAQPPSGSESDAAALQGTVIHTPEGDGIRLRFAIQSPLASTSLFLYESKGRGPFLQLTKEASEVRGSRRFWQAEILLPRESAVSDLLYLVSAPGLEPFIVQ